MEIIIDENNMEVDNLQLEIDVNLRFKDMLRYNVSIAYRSWFPKLILLIGILLTGWLIYSFITRTTTWDLFLSQNILMILVAVFILFSTPLRVWKITAMQLQSGAFTKSHYKFMENGIYIKLSNMEDTIPWNTYILIEETKNDFRLFVDKVQAQIIPKYEMTDGEIKRLRYMIQKAMPKENCKLKI